MAIGSNIAGTFRLPQAQGNPVQSIVDRGLAAEQEIYGTYQDPVPDLPKDLQHVQGQSEEVFKKWAELKQFAKTMWHNHRINVTRPDARNPYAIKAAEEFKKGLADIQYSANVLQRGQERVKLFDTAVAQGMGAYQVDPTQQNLAQISPEEAFYSTRAAQEAAEAANTAYAKSYDTKTATAQAQQGVNTAKERLQAIKAKLTGPAQSKVEEIKQSIQGPVYEQPQFHPDYSNGGKTPIDPKTVIDELSYVRRGLYNYDPSAIAWLKNQPNVSDVERTTNGARIINTKGKVYDINFNSTDGGFAALNELLNEARPAGQQLPTRDLLPYIQVLSQTDILPDDQSWMEIEDMQKVSQNMFADNFGVDDTMREDLKTKIKTSVDGKKFRLSNGDIVSDVKFDTVDRPGLGTGDDPVVKLIMYGGGEGKEDKVIELNLAKESDAKRWKEILSLNAGNLIDWTQRMKVKDRPVETIPQDIPKNMTRDQFKEYLNKKQGGGKFDVNSFIQKKSGTSSQTRPSALN